MKTLTFTGHRPPKLGLGYDLNDPGWDVLKNQIKKYLVENEITDAWVGMALGTDTIAAIAVLELRDEGYDIRLHCAIPCHDYDAKWLPVSRNQYADILNRADEKIYVTDGPYDEFCLSKRNFFMVDKADMLYAVWDGKPASGTFEAVTYATYKNIPIFVNKVIKMED